MKNSNIFYDAFSKRDKNINIEVDPNIEPVVVDKGATKFLNEMETDTPEST